MGLLDDAIREHLELKRRHGADPSEVARQESEALGPARRTAERRSEAIAEPDFDAPQVQARDTRPLDEDAPYLPEDLPEPDFGDAALESEPWEPVLEETAPEPAATRAPESFYEPEPEPEPELFTEPDPEPDPELDQPTRPFTTLAPQPAEEEDDDVLEGTPEFLEETPEHDRLWFEQRPPKDFDFDK
jgi:hypothetical protein